METTASPRAVRVAAPDLAESPSSFATIAEDRLEGALAIGHFIDPNMTPREARRLLEEGHYPCWREGRVYVASKAALLRHWREKTAQLKGQTAAQPRNKSARRGYLGSIA